MTRTIKIVAAIGTLFILLGLVMVSAVFFVIGWMREGDTGISKARALAYREIPLADHGTLVLDMADVRGRSEHGSAQRAGYRPAGASEVEWFGDACDGVDPQVYFSGQLVVVIDLPSACVFVRNGSGQSKWTDLALVFPNDLGPFPIAYYAQRNGLTIKEVSRISELGGKRKEKYPTTYIQSFDPKTRDLICSYHVDNRSSWPLHLRLSEDGNRLALVEVGNAE